MRLFKNKYKEPPKEITEVSRNMARKLEIMPVGELIMWGNQAMFDIGHGLDRLKESPTMEAALDIRRTVAVLYNVADELAKRYSED